jgi:hypothetical protein
MQKWYLLKLLQESAVAGCAYVWKYTWTYITIYTYVCAYIIINIHICMYIQFIKGNWLMQLWKLWSPKICIERLKTQESWWCRCSVNIQQVWDPGRTNISVQVWRQKKNHVPAQVDFRFNQPICREVNLYTQMLISSRKALTDIAQDNVGSNVSWPNQVDPEN